MIRLFVKKKISIILVVTLILSGLGLVEVFNTNVKAGTENFGVEQLIIDNYKNDNTPKPSETKYKDWLFAGWYEDAQCEKCVVSKTNATGKKYAKFVPQEVLSVMCQTIQGTNASTETAKMRIVTSVDTLNYREVGFDIVIGKTNTSKPIKTVYKQIKASNGGVDFTYGPEIFSSASSYFATVTIVNVPNQGFGKGILIKPYWITLDGSKVYGVSRYARVEDSYLKIVNVPVRINTDKEVAAGFAKVQYDATKVEYVGSDNGTIFDNVDTEDDNGTILCVGDINDISKNVEADGLYTNLRFKINDGVSLDSNLVFNVSGEQFCDINQNFVYTDVNKKTFEISDVVYKVVK